MLQSVILKDLYKEMNLFKILQLLFFIEVQPAKRHWESTSTAKQLSHKINKVPLLLKNLGNTYVVRFYGMGHFQIRIQIHLFYV